MIFKAFLNPVTKAYTERRILNTHPIHLFHIIQDVDRYQEFLPLCLHSKILSLRDSGRYFEATLTVGMPPLFKESYTSAVTVVPESLTVETRSIKSQMFDSLKSRWKLSSVDNNSVSVDFEVMMTVTDPLIVGVLDSVLSEVAGRQVEAFEKRCMLVEQVSDYSSPLLPRK